MICRKCGSKVEMGENFCPQCGVKVDYDFDKYFKGNDTLIKLLVGAFVLVAVCFVALYFMPFGRYKRAEYSFSKGKYQAAYDIVEGMSGEKAEAKRDFYWLMIETESFCGSYSDTGYTYDRIYEMAESLLPEAVYPNIGQFDTDATDASTSRLSSDVESAALNYRSKSNTKSKRSYLSQDEYKLLCSIKDCLYSVENSSDEISDFSDNLYAAYSVYDELAWLKEGNLHNYAEELDKFNTYKNRIDNALTLYKNYSNDKFRGYETINEEIEYWTEHFVNNVNTRTAKSGYFTEMSYYDPPYSYESVLSVVDDFKMAIAKYYLKEII